ncbi:MAG: Lrp/AsnC family transcriptional regulator [Methanoregula sp.]|nr:MAG: Lrp/AsnC family transcriptional regulator [Methanoregula sp.]
MDPHDLQILSSLEGGLPLVSEPYEEIGKQIGMNGEEVLERIRDLQASGIIRRFRARINQRLVGITANALVAWKCNGQEAGRIGGLLASYPCVTHCYERRPVPGKWEYNLYTVHHGFSRKEVQEEVRLIAGKTNLTDYTILFSTEEFKRVPNVRIRENGGGVL